MKVIPVWEGWGTPTLLAGFAILCALRLNGFSLLEPDSSEYVFGARSLATFHGYRAIDRAGEPLQTLWPPGLPVLLTPLSLVAPYSVVGAKIVVIVLSIVGVLLTVRLAARRASVGGALAAGLLVATSPYALLHATEIATEFPYLAGCLGAILMMTRAAGPPSRRQIVVASALLAFLPLLRTVGLALVVAVIFWCALDRSRRAFWPAPIAAIIVSGLLALRNGLAGGPSYFGVVLSELKRLGPSAFAAKAATAAGFYASRFLDVLLPGVWPGRPMYERMTVSGTPDLGGLHGLGLALAFAIMALAAFGAWSRRREDGALIAIYIAVFLTALAIYPPRQERLAWPLVPLVWALVPTGLSRIVRPYRFAALAATAGLLAWQVSASAAMVADNLVWASTDDRFYEERVPPIYFADWRAAGTWLHEHAPAGARILTRHSDVGFTSGLKQESVRFEELSPQEWRARIARLRARYLVVPTSLFGKFFPFDLLQSDPVYAYAVRWKGKDVAVLEILPNRTGRVEVADTDMRDAAQCERAAMREPQRVDLASRCAELLAAAGRRDVAITRLAALVDRGKADVRLAVTLGNLLLEAGRNDEAAAAFVAASGLPEAELLERTIERGRIAAEQPEVTGIADKLARARARMDGLRWTEAKAEIDDALKNSPDDPVVLGAAGELATRMGRYDDARRFYAMAGAKGDPSADSAASALASALSIEESSAAAPPGAILQAAAFWTQAGSPGRALDLIEHAMAARADEPELASRLAEIRRFYGLD